SGLYPIGIGAEYVNAASNQGSADFVVKTSSGGSAATKFVVQNGGNVGIGTTNPQSLLQVIGDIKSGQATSGSIALSTGSGSQSGYLTIYKSDGTTSLGYIGYDNSNLLYAARNSSNHIFNGGNVGIYTGTSVPAQAPAQTLTVAGTMSATGATTLASTLAVTDRATFSNGVTVGSTSQPTMTITSTSSALNGAPANASGTFYYEATGTETHMFGGNVVPDADGSRSLGMSGVRWGTIYSSNSTINTSDSRLKTNIENSVYGLQAVLRMRPVTYNWKKEPTTNHMVGFIAQEMEQIVPEAVEAPRTAGEYYGMKYTELIPVLTKAIQEQQAQIEALKVANSELQAQASELRDVKASLQSLAEQVQLLQANGSTATTK
ncbi:MAG: tail fiber domain-containing protein, partial [Janthinobacterium lividum]